jgi:hypothetical protein
VNLTQILSFHVGDFEVTVANDVAFKQNSADNKVFYEKEYLFGEHSTSKHSVTVNFQGKKVSSCVLIASGGPSAVHENSALIHSRSCIVAIGRYICSLSVPSLMLEWQTQIDDATCFGVYKSPKQESFISHGELKVACLSYSGEILWETSGKDIFTGDFIVSENHIQAVDFNGERYLINVEDGSSELIND